MPFDAPVTRATFPSSENGCCINLIYGVKIWIFMNPKMDQITSLANCEDWPITKCKSFVR
jgi:hypothetical protein